MRYRWNYKTFIKNLLLGILFLISTSFIPFVFFAIILAPPSMW